MVKQPSESLSRHSGRKADPATLAGRASNQSEAAQRRQSLAEKMRARAQGEQPADSGDETA